MTEFNKKHVTKEGSWEKKKKRAINSSINYGWRLSRVPQR